MGSNPIGSRNVNLYNALFRDFALSRFRVLFIFYRDSAKGRKRERENLLECTSSENYLIQ
jgi:hypothetical protein